MKEVHQAGELIALSIEFVSASVASSPISRIGYLLEILLGVSAAEKTLPLPGSFASRLRFEVQQQPLQIVFALKGFVVVERVWTSGLRFSFLFGTRQGNVVPR